jgi:hypothetical protein
MVGNYPLSFDSKNEVVYPLQEAPSLEPSTTRWMWVSNGARLYQESPIGVVGVSGASSLSRGLVAKAK